MIDDSVEVVTNMMPDLKEESVGLLEDQSHYIYLKELDFCLKGMEFL